MKRKFLTRLGSFHKGAKNGVAAGFNTTSESGFQARIAIVYDNHRAHTGIERKTLFFFTYGSYIKNLIDLVLSQPLKWAVF